MAILCASSKVAFNQAFAPNVVRRLADVTHLAFDVSGTSLEKFVHRPNRVHGPRDYRESEVVMADADSMKSV